MNAIIVIRGECLAPASIYPYDCLVLNPHIYDVCALLDAMDFFSDRMASKNINRVGSYFVQSSVYKRPVYYVYFRWLKQEELV